MPSPASKWKSTPWRTGRHRRWLFQACARCPTPAKYPLQQALCNFVPTGTDHTHLISRYSYSAGGPRVGFGIALWRERESGNGGERSNQGAGEDQWGRYGELKADTGGRTPSSVSHVSAASPRTLRFCRVTYSNQREKNSMIFVTEKGPFSIAHANCRSSAASYSLVFRLISRWNRNPVSGSSRTGIGPAVQAHLALDNSNPRNSLC